jgi:hypothetical protein
MMSKFWNILEKKNSYLPNQWRNGGSGAGNEHTGFDIKQLSDCPGQVKTAPNLSDRASENDSVICSIPEEQND